MKNKDGTIRDDITSGKEIYLWTNGVAFRKYQGQDKREYPKEGWRKVKAIIYEIKTE